LKTLHEAASLVKYVRAYGQKIVVDIPDIGRIPIEEIGSGDQELLQMLINIQTSQASVVLIEEPELHMHPRLQKELAFSLKKMGDRQFIITTHSDTFVDSCDPKQVYVVEYEEGTTKVKSLGELEDEIITLGIRPSEVVFADKVVIFRRDLERVFLSMLALKKGSLLSNVAVFDKEVNTRALARIIKFARLDVLTVNLKAQNVHSIIFEKPLEEYYPERLIMQWLKEQAMVDAKDVKEYERRLRQAKSKLDFLLNVYKSAKRSFEQDRLKLALYMAKYMHENELSKEMKEFLEFLES